MRVMKFYAIKARKFSTLRRLCEERRKGHRKFGNAGIVNIGHSLT